MIVKKEPYEMRTSLCETTKNKVTHSKVSGAGEVLSVLVEGHGHDAVGGVEGLLDAVAVVDVDVDVEHPLVVLEQLQDGQDDVVDVAEAGGLALLGVVEAAGPVDGDLRGLLVQLDRGGDGAAAGELAELVEAVEHGAVLADVEPLHLFVVLAHVVRSDGHRIEGMLSI